MKKKILQDTRLSLLDSGCNVTVSAYRNDFEWIDWDMGTPISGVDGPVRAGKNTAFVGKLKPNNLGLKDALFYPKLPMGRIISVTDMC